MALLPTALRAAEPLGAAEPSSVPRTESEGLSPGQSARRRREGGNAGLPGGGSGRPSVV